jgi:hypothetical protein
MSEEFYDYVVVGGGMTGTGITAELLEFRPNAKILIMDKLTQLGGHWNFAYPYVRLHNFTSYYTLYGHPMPDEIRKQAKHRANLTEILAYFNQIQRSFKEEKNLTMRFNVNMTGVEEKKDAPVGEAKWTINYTDESGKASAVKAGTLVMCTHCRQGGAPPHKPIVGTTESGGVPAGNIYPNQIDKMGDLKKAAKANQKIAVVGGGKTGADAVMHLYWSGIPMENIVWVKKWDLGFGIRATPQDAFNPPEKRGALALIPFCLKYQKGIPQNLTIHGDKIIQSPLPIDHPQYSDKVMYTGGGMLDEEELGLLKTVKQVLGGAVVANSDRVMTLADGTKVEYDWAIWCHGYDPTPYATVPRQEMYIGMIGDRYMSPINFFASASQGGRVMGRLLLMFEEGLLSWWMRAVFTMMAIFLGTCTGPSNSSLIYAKCGLLESYCAWALSRPKVVRRFGWGYFSAMGDMPWFFPGPMKGAKELAFKTIHIMEDAK